MGENTKIEWADDTFNPVEGCQKVGPGCDFCYAESNNARWNGGTATNWGPGAPRRRTSAANWRKPLKWDREQAAALAADPSAPPRFVFCASLADVFDNAWDPDWRRDLFDLIRATPNLTWLLLTKRPGNIVRLFSETFHNGASEVDKRVGDRIADGWWPKNAAIGCTVVNQQEADRDVPVLLEAKRDLNPAFAFLSMEPLLGPVDLRAISTLRYRGAEVLDAITGHTRGMFGDLGPISLPPLDQIIVGGESGPNARPMALAWPRDLLQQTEGTDVVFNYKQNGGRKADKGGHELDGRTYFGRPSI